MAYIFGDRGGQDVLNQDGSVQLQLGATEIGQGADTVFTQMAAETLHLEMKDIHIVTVQDTDVTPFDTGAYASRQSFITGTAVKQCAEQLRDKILAYAKTLLPKRRPGNFPWITLDPRGDEEAISLGALAQECYYSLTNSSVITAEVSTQVKKNTIATGCCFAEVEVDLKLGQIKILHIINVHDSGKASQSSAGGNAGSRRHVHGYGIRSFRAADPGRKNRKTFERQSSRLQTDDGSGYAGYGGGVCGA